MATQPIDRVDQLHAISDCLQLVKFLHNERLSFACEVIKYLNEVNASLVIDYVGVAAEHLLLSKKVHEIGKNRLKCDVLTVAVFRWVIDGIVQDDVCKVLLGQKVFSSEFIFESVAVAGCYIDEEQNNVDNRVSEIRERALTLYTQLASNHLIEHGQLPETEVTKEMYIARRAYAFVDYEKSMALIHRSLWVFRNDESPLKRAAIAELILRNIEALDYNTVAVDRKSFLAKVHLRSPRSSPRGYHNKRIVFEDVTSELGQLIPYFKEYLVDQDARVQAALDKVFDFLRRLEDGGE